ncbi:glycosyltransferase family 4 protein [Halolamina rubra]|uniref:glycosyltransferase family 4 protein n=1 Tax=Halolamina rubra TaxID=1380430 RepID=UPI0013771721|nr:glycosyltransferase family 4 protein [Halolamina rubra]
MESIPTGVDYSKFDPNIEDDKDGTLNGIFQNIPEDRVVVLQLGQIVYRKGSDLFAERATSYSGYPCSHFLLVGESQTEEFSKKVKEICQKSGDRITVYDGWVDFDKIPQLISSVDIVCLLSRPGHEGVPRVLQEACAMETPIIASNVEGITNMFNEKEGCFIIDPFDQESFDKAVKKSLEETPDRENFAKSIDMSKNYDRYRDIYDQIK